MENIIKITNVTIVENSVVISLERYEELIGIEKRKTTYFAGNNFFTGDKILYTDDEAIKELGKDYQEALSKIKKLDKIISEQSQKINNLKEPTIEKTKQSWFKKLFK